MFKLKVNVEYYKPRLNYDVPSNTYHGRNTQNNRILIPKKQKYQLKTLKNVLTLQRINFLSNFMSKIEKIYDVFSKNKFKWLTLCSHQAALSSII